jgi:hypothetical protein
MSNTISISDDGELRCSGSVRSIRTHNFGKIYEATQLLHSVVLILTAFYIVSES